MTSKHTKDKGERIFTLLCGCKILDYPTEYKIEYCPTHKAAPELLEACEYALEKMRPIKGKLFPIFLPILKALAKAKGKDDENSN